MQNPQPPKRLVGPGHFTAFCCFSRHSSAAALIKSFLSAPLRWFRSLFSLYFPAKVNFSPVSFLWLVDTAGKVNMYGESAGWGPTNLRRAAAAARGGGLHKSAWGQVLSRGGMWRSSPWTCGLLVRTDVRWTDCYRTAGRSKTQVRLAGFSPPTARPTACASSPIFSMAPRANIVA